MNKPTLSASLITDALTAAIISGEVGLSEFTLEVNAATSVDKNSRQMLALKYDVAEMSLATFVRAWLDGMPLIGIPAFTGRRFLQPMVCCAPAANIHDIGQLDGRRIALPQYWMTSSVWHRGILEQHYGVPQDRVRWVTTAEERLGTLVLPQGGNVRRAVDGMSPSDLLNDGAVDCMMLPKVPSGASGWISPFADVGAAQADYYQRSRIFPIMHMVVASTSALERHPGLARALMEMFNQAKDLANPGHPLGAKNSGGEGDDPWAYGVAPNLRALEAFLGYALEQGLIDRRIEPHELFADVN